MEGDQGDDDWLMCCARGYYKLPATWLCWLVPGNTGGESHVWVYLGEGLGGILTVTTPASAMEAPIRAKKYEGQNRMAWPRMGGEEEIGGVLSLG